MYGIDPVFGHYGHGFDVIRVAMERLEIVRQQHRYLLISRAKTEERRRTLAARSPVASERRTYVLTSYPIEGLLPGSQFIWGDIWRSFG
jgi:hypothetical protein